MRIRPLHFKVDLISSLILEKNVKNVDFPILIYSIAPKSGAIQYGGRSKIQCFHFRVVKNPFLCLIFANIS